MREARRDLEQMLDLSRPGLLAARDRGDHRHRRATGIDALWAAVARHRAYLESSGVLATRRAERLAQELRRVLLARSEARIAELAAGEEFATAVKALAAGENDPYEAADRLLGE